MQTRVNLFCHSSEHSESGWGKIRSMTTTTIYFFRHGKIHNPKKVFYGRHIPVQLSQEGQQGVKKFAQKLYKQHVHLDILYTSPLHRAVTTAHILAKALCIPSDNIVKLVELIDVHIPTLVGKPLTLRGEIHKSGIDEYSGIYEAAGHETRTAITHRMYSVVQRILKEQIGKTVGIVSHGDSLRFLLFKLLSKSEDIPSMGELKAIYYPPKGEGWRMSFDNKGNIIEAKLLPDGKDLRIPY